MKRAIWLTVGALLSCAVVIGFVQAPRGPAPETPEVREARHHLEMVLADQHNQFVKRMIELEIRARNAGDTRLAQHLHCEYDPPKQPANVQMCASLAAYYEKQEAADAEREKLAREKW